MIGHVLKVKDYQNSRRFRVSDVIEPSINIGHPNTFRKRVKSGEGHKTVHGQISYH